MTSNGNHIRYSLDSVESQRRDAKIPPIRVDSRRIISSHNSLACLQHQDSKYFNLNAKAQKPKEIAKKRFPTRLQQQRARLQRLPPVLENETSDDSDNESTSTSTQVFGDAF
ncbi:hypothetical protein WR25_10779 [Diploscapter pachys]|uniref:Uncharacterized protein n=1 Tax=Diploscapter pachys TaxID=2018661 RepID=A0A2A2JC46_9BILA|nr:hypothetical protein WR25_10779 [Diploscapter pachys]